MWILEAPTFRWRENVTENGEIYWSSFEGLVRGSRSGCSWSSTDHNGIGYFSRVEGLAYLKEIQKFWDGFEGEPEDAKIDNPHRQLSEMQVSTRALIRRQKLGIAVDYGDDGFDAPSPPPPPPRRSSSPSM